MGGGHNDGQYKVGWEAMDKFLGVSDMRRYKKELEALGLIYMTNHRIHWFPPEVAFWWKDRKRLGIEKGVEWRGNYWRLRSLRNYYNNLDVL